MIALRELKEKDAEYMLEWMHDPDIQKGFKKDFLDATIDDAKSFIKKSKIPRQLISGKDLHYAIVNDDDVYLGTISLKKLDLDNLSAEYAITTRKGAHGRGVGSRATKLILKKAFLELGLHRVYLNVYADNTDAIRLYKRCGFKYEGEFRDHIRRNNEFVNWKWFGMLDTEFKERYSVQ